MELKVTLNVAGHAALKTTCAMCNVVFNAACPATFRVTFSSMCHVVCITSELPFDIVSAIRVLHLRGKTVSFPRNSRHMYCLQEAIKI